MSICDLGSRNKLTTNIFHILSSFWDVVVNNSYKICACVSCLKLQLNIFYFFFACFGGGRGGHIYSFQVELFNISFFFVLLFASLTCTVFFPEIDNKRVEVSDQLGSSVASE